MGGNQAGQLWRGLLTPRWIAAHGLALAFVVACLLLGRWQIGRAAEGNLLSYGYAIQWPAFAAFAVWVWIAEMRKALRAAGAGQPDDVGSEPGAAHPDPSHPAASESTGGSPQPRSRRRRPRSEAAYDDSDDPALAAYNHYLSWLNAHPNATPADYPGSPARKEFTS